MKKTRESSNNQITLAEKQNLVACIASAGATHVEITMFTPDNADLIAHGFTPTPLTIEAETQQWYDVIHAQPNVYGAAVYDGYMKVFDRAVFPQTGDNGGSIVGYTIETTTPVGTAAGTSPIFDDFNRASIGTSYTTAADGGTGNSWTISATQLKGPAADGWKRTCLTTASYTNFVAVVKAQKIGHQQLVGRASTDANFPGYGFQMRDTTFRLERPGLESIAEVSKTFTTNAWYWIKISCNGTSIQGKVWAADDVSFPNSTNGSENEPGAWDISVTRSDFASGSVGVSGESSNGVFDNLTITPIANLNATWVGRYQNYLYNHVTLSRIQTGDIQCPFAEISATAFSGHFWTTQSGAHTAVAECHKVCNTFAATAGKTVVFLNNPNYSETNSGWWNGYTDTGVNCFDYYGNARGNLTVKPSDYVADLANTYAGVNVNGGGNPAAGYPMFWGEWGDLSGSIRSDTFGRNSVPSGDNFVTGTTTEEQWMNYLILFFRAIRDGLVNTTPQKLIGFNWWGGWEGQNTSIVYKTGSGAASQYHLNWRGQILRNFYINDGMGRLPIPTQGTYTEASPSFGGRQQNF